MFMSILKKDLKRKKTMNLILLLFIVMSAMFAASSVNNIISVVGGLDYYFDKAGMADYYMVVSEKPTDTAAEELLDNNVNVKAYKREDLLYGSQKNIKVKGEDIKKSGGISTIMPISNAKLNYFDENNEVITEIEKGKVRFPIGLANEANIEIGDKIELVFDEQSIELEYAGVLKDALFGSEMMSNPRFMLNDSDYEELIGDSDIDQYYGGSIYYIESDDVKALTESIATVQGVLFSSDNTTIKTTYIMGIIIAAIMLIMGVCLIFISFVVLKFTLKFTIEEEFREIGVMKALGLKNSSIRGIYLTKYLAISIVGAAVGYGLSIPFGNMLLNYVGRSMVLGNDNSVLIGIICSAAVVLVIMLFCWSCTSKVKKMSPIDAVRNGQTGERFGKKSILSLGTSRLTPTGFLSVNDVVSAPKSYGLITLIFTLCIVMVMILANTANTLNSDKIMYLLNCTVSDAYYTDNDGFMQVMGGVKTADEREDEIEEQLAENGMPATVHAEYWYKLPIESENAKLPVVMMHCKETETTDYVYNKGTAPQNEHEVAFTQQIADKLEVGIGDTVNIQIGGKNEEFLVTALFSSMDQMGSVGRLHQSVDISEVMPSSTMGYQIDFDDDPDAAETDRRIEKLKDIFGSENVFNAKDFVDDCTKAGGTLVTVKNLLLVISAIILALVSILMERSFIAKEKAEIALMKAIGLKDSKVIAQHVMRFGLAGIAAAVLAGSLCMPLTKLSMNPIFALMGADNGVSYQLRPLEVFVFYPIVLIAIMMLSVFLTSLYTKKINSSQTADIE